MPGLAAALGRIGGRWGECVTVDRLCPDSGAKQWLGAELGADVIDMESFWVSDVAARNGIPHLVVRTVLDPAEEPLPRYAVLAAEQHQMRSLGAASRYILARPWEVPGLVRIWRHSGLASTRLSSALSTLVSEPWASAFNFEPA